MPLEFGEEKIVKRLLMGLMVMVLTLMITLPTAISATGPLSVVSDTTVQVIGVYNKANVNSAMVSLTNHYAVRAAEPYDYTHEGSEATNSIWDTGVVPSLYFQTQNPGADWIWETERAEDPAGLSGALKDTNASNNGRVVVFQKTFEMDSLNYAAKLYITADNCYEVWINGNLVGGSALQSGWETSNLDDSWVNKDIWKNIGQFTIPQEYFVEGTNTIEIHAANESYFDSDNNPKPAYTANPYSQANPAGLIFKMDFVPISAPTPEMPAGLLFGLGLLVVGGIVLVNRNKAARAHK
jgi:hypothetical protein